MMKWALKFREWIMLGIIAILIMFIVELKVSTSTLNAQAVACDKSEDSKVSIAAPAVQYEIGGAEKIPVLEPQ